MIPPSLALVAALAAVDGPVRSVDPIVPGSAEAIAAATSDPRFLSPWVASLPDFPERALAHGLPGPDRRGARRARGHREGERLPARAGRRLAAGASLHDRAQRGRPRDPDARDRRRGRHPRARPPQGGDRSTRGPEAHRSRRGRAPDRERAADLLPERGAALRRDRLHRGHARARLPAGGLRAADDPAHPAGAGGAHQPGLEPRRARQHGRVVLPLPEGQDRLRRAAAPVAALLVELRVRRHQPRHAPADARDHEGRPPDVPRVASDGGPRPARGVRAAADLERHRPLQPEHRPDHLRRVPGDELPRGARP